MVESLYALSELRAEYLIIHAFEGFGVDVEEAIQLLKAKNDNTLTQQDRDKIDRLLAAVRNLIEFAVAEEYQLWKIANEIAGDVDVDFNSEEYDELIDECERYNKTYATVENEDAKYAMAMAAWWIGVGRRDYLMYMTQGDDRVRPWHAVLEGFTARRDDFPSWMIPPIEWGCRCYLIDMAGDSVENDGEGLKKVIGGVNPAGKAAGTTETSTIGKPQSSMMTEPKKPKELSGVFEESVCKCGRIFGEKHPYFIVDEKDVDMLNEFVELLKGKWYAG